MRVDYYLHESKVKDSVMSTLCDPMDCILPGSSVHRILQSSILEWVAISYFRGSSWPRDQTQVSCVVGTFFTISATRETHYLHTFHAFIAYLTLFFLIVLGCTVSNLVHTVADLLKFSPYIYWKKFTQFKPVLVKDQLYVHIQKKAFRSLCGMSV